MRKILLVGFLICISLTSVYSISFNYPSFFQDKESQIIVGSNAARSDYTSALKLSNDILYELLIDPGVTTTKSFISSLVPLGSSITSQFDEEIDSRRLKGLKNRNILFQGQKYDVSDVLFLSPGKIVVQNSLNGDPLYGSDPVIEFSKNSLKYYHRFDKEIDLRKITPQNPLRINFLGNSLLITKINSDNSFNAQIGESYLMRIGDSVRIDDKTITLTNIDSKGDLLINIGSASKVVPMGSSRIVDGIDIYNEKSFYINEISERSAKLLMGKNIKKTFVNDDSYIGQDKTKPKWIWNIGNLETVGISIPSTNNNGDGPYIGIKNTFELNDFKDNPPKIGECLDLPNNYLSICFEELLNDEYKLYSIEVDKVTDLSKELGEDYSKVKSVKLSTNDGSEGFVVQNNLYESKISSIKKTREILLYAQDAEKLGVFYRDSGEKRIKLAGYINKDESKAISEIKHGNTKGKNIEIYVEFSPNNQIILNLKSFSNEINKLLDDISINFDLNGFEINSLGNSAQSSEDSEITWNGKNIGTRDKDSLTNYGIIIKNTKSVGNSDKVKLEIPNNQVKANIYIKGPEIVRIEDGTRTMSVSPGVYLDNEISGIDKNTILIGGPCANPKVGELFELTCESWNLNEGESLLKIKEINENIVLLIAGTTAQDTINSINILEDFGFDFEEDNEEAVLLI